MFNRFRHLQWKLTLSYTLVTTAVLFISNSAISLFGFYQLERTLIIREKFQEAVEAQLERLVQTKEQLSALEERGHLARELHDTIKQQVFSSHMQLSALKLAHPNKPELVKELITKLLENRTQAAVYAWRESIISPGE
jgi:signal transduction histidine kinase